MGEHWPRAQCAGKTLSCLLLDLMSDSCNVLKPNKMQTKDTLQYTDVHTHFIYALHNYNMHNDVYNLYNLLCMHTLHTHACLQAAECAQY